MRRAHPRSQRRRGPLARSEPPLHRGGDPTHRVPAVRECRDAAGARRGAGGRQRLPRGDASGVGGRPPARGGRPHARRRPAPGGRARRERAAAMIRDQYLSGEYLVKNPLWHADESPWKAKYVLQMIARNKLAPTTICDVGCGAGEVLRLVHEGLQGRCRCWGYDISPQAFARSRRLSSERLQFKLADIRQTPWVLARRVAGFVARAIMSLPSRVLFAIHEDWAVRLGGQWRLLVLAR